jgi:glutathione S-transferase
VGAQGQGEAMLMLYFAPGSSSMAVHIALHEIGAPYEARPVSMAKQEQRAPSFLALNPLGQIPVLLIDGRALTEVAAILFYLAKKFPAAALLPTGDIEAEARVVSWMSFVATALHPARGRGLDYAAKVYAIADRRLGDEEWAIGRYSIADIHLFRPYWRMVGSLHPNPGQFPRLSAHFDRMMARPAVQKTIEIESAIGYELPA